MNLIYAYKKKDKLILIGKGANGSIVNDLFTAAGIIGRTSTDVEVLGYIYDFYERYCFSEVLL